MATLSSILSFSPLPLPSSRIRRSSSLPSLAFSPLQPSKNPRKIRTLRTVVRACSASSFDDLYSKTEIPRSKKSVLLNLVQEIEPMDVSLIQKDVPLTTVDAMKRTISGMLGLLPSNQFQVLIEAVWEPLSKLLVSSMMTGYTLRNAEYRLCLERNLDIDEGSIEIIKTEDSKFEAPRMLLDYERRVNLARKDEMPKLEKISDKASESIGVEGLGKITPEAQQYILNLHSRLSSVKKELHEVKRKTAALQMQQFVGEEKNDLLDYLRSLQPEKVAELSEPTCTELKEVIHSVIHGLLATLSPKMHSKAPLSENTSTGIVNVGIEEDCIDLVENASLQYQPLISLTRDYLARLLFCVIVCFTMEEALVKGCEIVGDRLLLLVECSFSRPRKCAIPILSLLIQ
ncbi:hypothetical protein CsSME_00009708 [Camellia sinensis var. sinensis]